MRSSRTPSIAALLRKQAKARGSLVPFEGRRNLPAPSSAKTIVTFPRAGLPPLSIELDFLNTHPRLIEPITCGFRLWGASHADKTKIHRKRDLAVGWFGFLQQTGRADLTLADFDKSLMLTFISWLNSDEASRHGNLLQPSVRSARFYALIAIVEALRDDPGWGLHAQGVIADVPRNLWVGRTRKTSPRPRLSKDHLARIISAAEGEVFAIARRLQRGEHLLAKGREALCLGGSYRKDQGLCLAALEWMYPGVIPNFQVIRRHDTAIGNAARILGREETAGYFYASGRDLVPFVLLLSVATAFNSDTILSLEWSNIAFGNRFGQQFVRIVGSKPRAATDPVATLDATAGDGTNAAQLFDLLRRLTERLRPHITDPRDEDHVFLFVPERGDKRVTSFGRDDRDTQDSKWRLALRSFIKDHGLEPFYLAQIRPTILDEIQVTTGDILAARAVGQQQDPQTLWRHYTSDGTIQRYNERLGEVFLARERWRETHGVIDPRSRLLAPAMDRGAATPGFICLDPMDSPLPGQRRGRLCNAYGHCPSCPLAAAEIGKAANVALYQGLRQAIYAAQPSVGPKAWVARWAPILLDVDALLQFVDPVVAATASRLNVKLPTVG